MAATLTARNGSTLETAGLPADNPALRRFALLTAAATFVLVWMGGLVTSHEAGLSVPDWPNTYGYNLFFFPISKWISGIFYEHTHRLVASGVGLLTTILALWLFGRKSRPLLRWGGAALLLAGLAALCFNPQSAPHNHLADDLLLACLGLAALAASFVWPNCEPSPKWLRRLGVLAFFAVVAQGVLGGLRVTMLKDQLGIFHATLAQLFFVLMSAIALFHTPFWRNLPARAETDTRGLRYFFLGATLLIAGQLALGATMRHQHAGLAIPDFPAAYGKIWPDTAPASIARYNQLRTEIIDYQPITAFQVVLQMVHRLMAVTILLTVGACAWLARRQPGLATSLEPPLLRLALADCGADFSGRRHHLDRQNGGHRHRPRGLRGLKPGDGRAPFADFLPRTGRAGPAKLPGAIRGTALLALSFQNHP